MWLRVDLVLRNTNDAGLETATLGCSQPRTGPNGTRLGEYLNGTCQILFRPFVMDVARTVLARYPVCNQKLSQLAADSLACRYLPSL